MKISKFIGAAIALPTIMLTSCLNNGDSEQTQTERYSSAFSYTASYTTGAIINAPQTVSMEITTNFTNLDMDVTLMPMKLADGVSIPKASIEDLKLQSNKTGWLIAEGTNVQPTAEGFGMLPTLTKAKIAAIDHLATLEGRTIVGYERAVRLEEGNSVTYAAPNTAWCTGETKVFEIGNTDAQQFTSKMPIYLLALDIAKSTATIQIYNAVFAPAMENLGLKIEFRDLPFTVDVNGRITISRSEQFNPYHNDAPNAGFPISNLVCHWDLFSGIDISFNCGAKGSNYQVYANMPFNYGVEQTDKN